MKKLLRVKETRFRTYRAQLRYALFRWIMPRLGYDPHFHMNLAQKAWPKIGALTAGRDYTTDQVECLDCGENGYGDGSSNLLEEYAKTSRPVVLKGYLGRDVWTFDRAIEEAGQIVQKVRVGDYDKAPENPNTVKMRVVEFIDYLVGRTEFPYKDQLAAGKGPYLASVKLTPLEPYLPRPSFFSNGQGNLFGLGGDSLTPLHCHQHCDVLLVQLVGRRRVALVPPHQATLVGCIPRNYNACTAEFDPFRTDQEQYPGADLIHQLHCELEAGDALLIPGIWFHAIRISSPSLAVSQFNQGRMPMALGGGERRQWQERAFMQGWG